LSVPELPAVTRPDHHGGQSRTTTPEYGQSSKDRLPARGGLGGRHARLRLGGGASDGAGLTESPPEDQDAACFFSFDGRCDGSLEQRGNTFYCAFHMARGRERAGEPLVVREPRSPFHETRSRYEGIAFHEQMTTLMADPVLFMRALEQVEHLRARPALTIEDTRENWCRRVRQELQRIFYGRDKQGRRDTDWQAFFGRSSVPVVRKVEGLDGAVRWIEGRRLERDEVLDYGDPVGGVRAWVRALPDLADDPEGQAKVMCVMRSEIRAYARQYVRMLESRQERIARERREVASLREQGASMRLISRATGLSLGTVMNRLS